MAAETDEQRFYEVLKGMELDLRYLDFCRKRRAERGRPQRVEMTLPEITACVERLPLVFRYVKSEKFFRFREKINGATLFFQLSMRSDLVTPAIYLETEEYAYGMPLARLSLRLIKTREGYQAPQPSELALPFSGDDDLFSALEFVTSLFMEARDALKAAAPWAGEAQSC